VNLCFLVEGRHTERRVYDAWVRHTFPRLRLVRSLDELVADAYLILTGGGYPSYLKYIPETLADLRDHPFTIDHFFVCVDSEERSYASGHLPSLQVLLSTWSSLV
jgi:hypothetical protein